MSDTDDDYLNDDSFGDREIILDYVLNKDHYNDVERLGSLKYGLKKLLPLYFLYDEVQKLKEDSTFTELEQNEKKQIYKQVVVDEILSDVVRVAGIYGVYLAYDILFW